MCRLLHYSSLRACYSKLPYETSSIWFGYPPYLSMVLPYPLNTSNIRHHPRLRFQIKFNQDIIPPYHAPRVIKYYSNINRQLFLSQSINIYLIIDYRVVNQASTPPEQTRCVFRFRDPNHQRRSTPSSHRPNHYILYFSSTLSERNRTEPDFNFCIAFSM